MKILSATITLALISAIVGANASADIIQSATLYTTVEASTKGTDGTAT